jgi:plastocyanin
VVWFAGAQAAATETPAAAVVDQIDKQFVPELTVIRKGTEVQFPNSDAVSHHVYSFAQPNSFELPLYKGEAHPAIRFDHAGVVTLGCNIHDLMLGYIVVVDTPHYAITNQDGYARFLVPPAADADVFVWSPRLDPAAPLLAASVIVTDAGGVVQLTRRQRAAPRPFSGSLVWEDY